jgi:hypothetical protein
VVQPTVYLQKVSKKNIKNPRESSRGFFITLSY